MQTPPGLLEPALRVQQGAPIEEGAWEGRDLGRHAVLQGEQLGSVTALPEALEQRAAREGAVLREDRGRQLPVVAHEHAAARAREFQGDHRGGLRRLCGLVDDHSAEGPLLTLPVRGPEACRAVESREDDVRVAQQRGLQAFPQLSLGEVATGSLGDQDLKPRLLSLKFPPLVRTLDQLPEAMHNFRHLHHRGHRLAGGGAGRRSAASTLVGVVVKLESPAIGRNSDLPTCRQRCSSL
mmetsp:Transcript_113190/g.359746  ORF Transcript_113190/g.359746 Transcript_113190/m.359746 type:complete len:238 (+) Transcript_113190:827-1540(+)